MADRLNASIDANMVNDPFAPAKQRDLGLKWLVNDQQKAVDDGNKVIDGTLKQIGDSNRSGVLRSIRTSHYSEIPGELWDDLEKHPVQGSIVIFGTIAGLKGGLKTAGDITERMGDVDATLQEAQAKGTIDPKTAATVRQVILKKMTQTLRGAASTPMFDKAAGAVKNAVGNGIRTKLGLGTAGGVRPGANSGGGRVSSTSPPDIGTDSVPSNGASANAGASSVSGGEVPVYQEAIPTGGTSLSEGQSRPIVAVETRPSFKLNPDLAAAPDDVQAQLRTDVMRHSASPSTPDQMEFYRLFGIPHSVVESDGSFEGAISPNYLITPHAYDMGAVSFIGGVEGLMNGQDGVAIIRPVHNANGTPSVLISRSDGQPLSFSDRVDLYDQVNTPAISADPLDYTHLPNMQSMIFGNYVKGLSNASFFNRMKTAVDHFGDRYKFLRFTMTETISKETILRHSNNKTSAEDIRRASEATGIPMAPPDHPIYRLGSIIISSPPELKRMATPPSAPDSTPDPSSSKSDPEANE